MKITKLKQLTIAHYDLLLSADPSKELVQEYVQRGDSFEITANQLLGIIVLLPTRPDTIEIVNIAVTPTFQGQGVGQKLLTFALNFAKEKQVKTVEIGTGSTSLAQLYLYQKCGFRMDSIDKGFFTRHYQKEIRENGLILKDMVRLKIDL